MAGDVKFTVTAGRDATFKGVAVGDGAKAVAIEGWMAEASEHFSQIFNEIERAKTDGALTPVQAALLTDTAKQAEEVVKGGLKSEPEKEKAGFLLGNLVSGFKNFCTDQHRAGVFSCVQALVALCSIPIALVGHG
jgi:hypothetical protein